MRRQPHDARARAVAWRSARSARCARAGFTCARGARAARARAFPALSSLAVAHRAEATGARRAHAR
eukprot:3060925-Prymnesium_polylepis.1